MPLAKRGDTLNGKSLLWARRWCVTFDVSQGDNFPDLRCHSVGLFRKKLSVLGLDAPADSLRFIQVLTIQDIWQFSWNLNYWKETQVPNFSFNAVTVWSVKQLFTLNFRLCGQISIGEIWDEFVRDFKSSRNWDKAYSNWAGPTWTWTCSSLPLDPWGAPECRVGYPIPNQVRGSKCWAERQCCGGPRGTSPRSPLPRNLSTQRPSAPYHPSRDHVIYTVTWQ